MDCHSSLVFSVLVYSLVLARCSALIPIIGWSNSDAFSSVKGNQFKSAEEFLYASSLDNVQTIVVFKSPELSFDSLAKYGGMFNGDRATLSSLQSELKESKSSVWAGSEGSVTSELIQTLSLVLETQPLVITGAEGVDFTHRLLVVQLHSSSGEDGLRKQDQTIGEVMAAIEALTDSSTYAAIYSADHTHPPRPQDDLHRVRRSRRETMFLRSVVGDQSSTTQCAAVEEGGQACLLFCLSNNVAYRTNGSLSYKNKNTYSDKISNFEFTGGACSNSSIACNKYGSAATCVMLTGSVNDSSVDMVFVFRKGVCSDASNSSIRCGFWSMELYVDDELYQRAREEQYIFSDFLIPLHASYSCGYNKLNTFLQGNFSSGNKLAYHFEGIQAQAFGGIKTDLNKNLIFGSSYNCQGFLSTVTLMGLVVGILLVLVLYCSVAFMFSIQTFDRFDDPRGTAITVQNLH